MCISDFSLASWETEHGLTPGNFLTEESSKELLAYLGLASYLYTDRCSTQFTNSNLISGEYLNFYQMIKLLTCPNHSNIPHAML